MVFSQFRSEFGARIDRRIDLPAERFLGVLQTDNDVRKRQVADDQKIDIASRLFVPSGDRAIDKGKLNILGYRSQSAANRISDPDGLCDQALYLRKYGRVGIGLEIHLPAVRSAPDNSGLSKKFEFPLHRPQAISAGPDNLPEIERFICMAEQ